MKAIATLFAIIALSGCAPVFSAGPDTSKDELRVETVTLPNGKTIYCVRYRKYWESGGVSCDWQNRE